MVATLPPADGSRRSTGAHPSTVVVIGAGIAGASAAWALARAGVEVILLELESQAGTHATGRSAAVLSETSGLREVCALAAVSRPFFTSPPPEFEVGPLISPRGLLWVSQSSSSTEIDVLVDAARRNDITLEPLSAEEAVAMVPVLKPSWLGAAFYEPDAMSIDVDLLLQGYLRAFTSLGGEVRLSTPAVASRRDGDRWVVELDDPASPGESGATLVCDVVVDAAGAWADEVAERAGLPTVGLQPLRRTAFTFPVAAADVVNWPLVMDLDNTFYFEPEAPGLLASPSEETLSVPCDARAEEEDIARAVDALGEATELVVKGVRHRWAGLRTFTPDRLPVVGADPLAPGFVWLAGQGGAGIKTAPALAEAIVSIVTGTEWPAALTALDVTADTLSPTRLRSPIVNA